ncbi:ABC transporter permease [Georgenia ruanii]|uniref:ABC transporter permease subunit n=1 Tax=Georgenia ruanii TaxID=348442 RepID=A0A7J9UTV9_9MICO|nr:ABC transporter permease [Georgenia ruanii]MPV87942.1 ABC transporter permease subunit [Georgenia ruanii]
MLRLSRPAKIALAVVVAVVLLFLYAPLGLVVLNSFNGARVAGWPIDDWSLRWWGAAFGNDGVRAALGTSLVTAAGATAVAMVLGTLAAFALQRHEFFGRSSVNLMLVLPIALPGIVTGVALSNTYKNVLEPIGIQLGFFGLVVAHATFCIVMVFNNVQARLGRISPSLEEASADLGAGLGQTFRLVTFPAFRTAFVAGALLAFALSFDEIVVTIFTAPPGVETLPIWMYNNMARPTQASILNVVATVVIAFSMIPVYLSQRLARSIHLR